MQNHLRLLTPGPTAIPDRVRLAMAMPMIHHRKPEFKAVLEETRFYLKKLFGTEQEVLPLASSGTGAMTAAVINLFSRGEKILVAQAGKFGERWRSIAQVQGLEIVEIAKPWGEAVLAEDIEAALKQHTGIKGVCIQICETSTGVMHPIHEIAKVTRKYDVLLVADGISSVGISPAPMDEWGIDVLLTGSQKGLMVPAGLSLLAFSEKAWKKAEQTETSCFYFNLKAELKNVLKNQTNFSSPVSLIVGLKEALAMIFEDARHGGCGGLDALYQKHFALAQMTRSGIKAMGLEPFAKTHYAWGLTSVTMPQNVSGSELVGLAAKETGVVIAAGQEPMKDEMIRLAHMGHVDFGDMLAGLYAVARSLPQKPAVFDNAYMSIAMQAYENAPAYPKNGVADA